MLKVEVVISTISDRFGCNTTAYVSRYVRITKRCIIRSTIMHCYGDNDYSPRRQIPSTYGDMSKVEPRSLPGVHDTPDIHALHVRSLVGPWFV